MTAERVGSVVFLALSGAFLAASLLMPVGRPNSPGPGFMPLLLSLLMVLLSAGFTWSAFRRPGQAAEEAEPQGEIKQTAWLILGLVAYCALLTTVGFLVLTLVFLVIFMRLLGTRRWWIVLVVALAVTGASILTFEVWLSIPFPRGVWWPQ